MKSKIIISNKILDDAFYYSMLRLEEGNFIVSEKLLKYVGKYSNDYDVQRYEYALIIIYTNTNRLKEAHVMTLKLLNDPDIYPEMIPNLEDIKRRLEEYFDQNEDSNYNDELLKNISSETIKLFEKRFQFDLEYSDGLRRTQVNFKELCKYIIDDFSYLKMTNSQKKELVKMFDFDFELSSFLENILANEEVNETPENIMVAAFIHEMFLLFEDLTIHLTNFLKKYYSEEEIDQQRIIDFSKYFFDQNEYAILFYVIITKNKLINQILPIKEFSFLINNKIFKNLRILYHNNIIGNVEIVYYDVTQKKVVTQRLKTIMDNYVNEYEKPLLAELSNYDFSANISVLFFKVYNELAGKTIPFQIWDGKKEEVSRYVEATLYIVSDLSKDKKVKEEIKGKIKITKKELKKEIDYLEMVLML